MKYSYLTGPSKVVEWARGLITGLTQREAAIDEKIKALEARATDAEDRLTAGGL